MSNDQDSEKPNELKLDPQGLSETDHDPDETLVGDQAKLTTPHHGFATVEGYEILQELGRGGMGVVYKAKQLALNRTVALKMVLAGAHSSDRSRQRFLREAEASAKLQHPNIVRVYDLGEQDGQPFFAMDFIEGTDLQNADPMDPREAAQVMLKLAEAAHYAHEQGIVHRDIKPANILIDKNGEPRITDFGLAKLLSDDSNSLTADDQLLGTAAYMPPEQARGDSRHVGPAADIYSLGAVLYYLLTGGAPFTGDSILEILKKVENDEPVAPRRSGKSIPKDLETICLKCLEKNTSHRYKSATDLADDLNRFLAGDAIHASAAGPVSRAARYVRRKTGAQIALAVISICIAFAAYRYWEYREYKKPTYTYFANMEMRFGVATGLGPLSKNETGRRSYFKILRAGKSGPVQSVEHVDALGRLTANGMLDSMLQVSYDIKDERETEVAKTTFNRDADGNLVDMVAFDEFNTKLWSFRYSEPPLKGQYLGPDGYEKARKGSGASYVESELDELGRATLVRFFDRNQRPQINVHGMYGFGITYDDATSTSLWHDVDHLGKAIERDGAAFRRFTHDSEWNLIRIEYLDADENLVVASGGAAVLEFEFSNGSQKSMTFLDTMGKPVSVGGYTRVESSLDGLSRIVAKRYYDGNGDLVITRDGYAEVRYEFDENGRNAVELYFGADSKPILSKDGYASVKNTFDERGHVVKQRFYGRTGEPAVNSIGIHQTYFTFDEQGNEIQRSYFDADLNPTLNDQGISSQKIQFERARPIREEYFGVDGTPTLSKLGYASVAREYDDRGNLVLKKFFDAQNLAVSSVDGFAIERFEFDLRGNETRHRLYDANDQPVSHSEGWHSIASTYDNLGNQIRRAYFDTSNRPTWFYASEKYEASGYSALQAKFDSRGLVTSRTFLDVEGKPTTSTFGFSTATYEYDRFGNITEIGYFDVDGQPAFNSRLRVARIKSEFDSRGNNRRIAWYGKSGKPINGVLGVATVEQEFDDRNNVILMRGFDAQGRPKGSSTNQEQNSPVVRFTYDDRGNSIGMFQFDGNNQPELGAGNFFRSSTKYDQRGQEIEARFFDLDGQPALHRDGYSRKTFAYDEYGNVIEQRFYGIDGELAINTRLNLAISKETYDRLGNITSTAAFGVDGQPILTADGMHQFVATYDDQGQLVKAEMLGTDNKPTLCIEQWASRTDLYNDRGQLIEERWFGTDGELTHAFGFFAIRRRVYDERGNQIETRVFDRNEKPTKNKWGVAVYLLEYDEHGRETKMSVFDQDEKPTEGLPFLYASRTMQYNHRGDSVRNRFYGTDGKLKNNPDGYAEWRAEYDNYGRQVEDQYFDENGERRDARVKVEFVTPNSPASAAGIRVGDVVMEVDGAKISGLVNYLYRRELTNQPSEIVLSRRGDVRTVTFPAGIAGVNLVDVLDEPDVESTEPEE